MKYPQSIIDVVHEQAKKHGNDIQKGINTADKLICELPEFDDWINTLRRGEVSRLFYAARHDINRRIMKQVQWEGNKNGQVLLGNSPTVQEAFNSYYNYNMGGKTLGMLYGRELPEIALAERSISKGHEFRARLADVLRPMVPDNKRVMKAVTENSLKEVFESIAIEVFDSAEHVLA